MKKLTEANADIGNKVSFQQKTRVNANMYKENRPLRVAQ